MSKLTAALSLLFVVACGPSEKEVQNTATTTCNIITESQGMNAVVRLKEINAAREKIGEDTFLGKDNDILLSFKYGLCKNLVRNDDDYKSLLVEQQKQEAIELAEQERILVSKKGKQEKISRKKTAEAAKTKAAGDQERLKDLTVEETTTANEERPYWRNRKNRIAAAEKITAREQRLITYWRSLDKTQWEELYPQQTSMQKDGWKRCETMTDSTGEACKKNWRRVHDKWKQVVKERMSYSDALKKSDRGRDLN